MLERDLYRQILGVDAPWRVTDVAFDRRPLRPQSRNPLGHWEGEVTVTVEYPADGPLRCPTCGEEFPGYDRRTRRWRHLDTCQDQTIVVCRVPRVRCE